MRNRVWLLVAAAVVAIAVGAIGGTTAKRQTSAATVAQTTTTTLRREAEEPGVLGGAEAPPAAGATTVPAAAPAGLPPVVASANGIVLPVTGQQGDKWVVATPCGASAVVAGTPVGPIDVVLDAGHGGIESGAVSPDGFREKDLNLAVVAQVQRALAAQGVRVLPTRTGDYRMTLGARAAVDHAALPRAFVSIHHNAEPDGPWPGPGTETYYQRQSPESMRLASLIQEEVVRALSTLQGISWTADRDAGAKYRTNVEGDDYYAMIRRTHGTPAALAELGFITNPTEAAAFRRPEVQQLEGEAVARGILRFLRTKDPGSGFVTPYDRPSPGGNSDGGGAVPGCVDPAF